MTDYLSKWIFEMKTLKTFQGGGGMGFQEKTHERRFCYGQVQNFQAW